MNQRFRDRLLAKDLLVGTVVTIPAPEIAEILAEVGFDWLFIDAEHGPLDTRDTQALLQAAGLQCPGLVRVPVGEEVWLKRALDTGASGVIVPQVSSANQAERVVSLCKYPPQGIRGVGVAQANRYGMRFQEYVETANEQVVIVIQAEHVDAVKNIQSIVKVPGIDAVLVGPYDLSASLGKAGRIADPEVRECIRVVRDTCLDVGLPVGAFVPDAAVAGSFIEQGFALIAVSLDVVFWRGRRPSRSVAFSIMLRRPERALEISAQVRCRELRPNEVNRRTWS